MGVRVYLQSDMDESEARHKAELDRATARQDRLHEELERVHGWELIQEWYDKISKGLPIEIDPSDMMSDDDDWSAVRRLRRMRRRMCVVYNKIESVVFCDPYDARCVLRASSLSWRRDVACRVEDGRLSVEGVEWLLGIVRQRPKFPQRRLERWLGEPLDELGMKWWKSYFWRRRRRLLRLLRRAVELGEGLVVQF